MDAQAQPSFVRARLPWIVAAAALVTFFLTRSQWISLHSLAVVEGHLAADALPPLSEPLLYLLTRPLLLLPSSAQLFVLNASSILFAALTLALLTRSVALLPHDRTREERRREPGERALLDHRLAWLPPLIAALLCGLQISFWEQATAGTGAMLNLLLLAYIVRCLLEFRIDPRESWLTRMAFVYGLATTNNYAMIGFFPLTLAAVIWIRGWAFFRAGFILRMTLWGLAGLLPYFVLPVAHVLQESGTGFWLALKWELVLQKRSLLQPSMRLIALFGALTSLVPLFMIGIRWPSTFGDTSAIGNTLINVAFRVVYLAFLSAGLWVMLDDPQYGFSQRVLLENFYGQRTIEPQALPSHLSFYYLTALPIGYFVGYLLLVFGRPEIQRHRRQPSAANPLNLLVVGVAILACLATIGTLIVRNAPSILTNNGSILKSFAQNSVDSLPSQTSIVMADNVRMLALVRRRLADSKLAGRHLLVNTHRLSSTLYHKELHQAMPQLWPNDFASTNNLDANIHPIPLAIQVGQLAAKSPIVYLHPSFGSFFEHMYIEPEGLTYRTPAYATNQVHLEALSPDQIQANNDYWDQLSPTLESLLHTVEQGSKEAQLVGQWYSKALNFWGVRLQQSAPDQLQAAHALFAQAHQLNPDNACAVVNRRFNEARQAGSTDSVITGQLETELFGKKYRGWNDLMLVNGPVDEPKVCYELGLTFADELLLVQAAQQFKQSTELQPSHQVARLELARTYTTLVMPEPALATIDAIQTLADQYPITPHIQAQMAQFEAWILVSRNETETAEKKLLTGLQKDPLALPLIETLTGLYLRTSRPDEAVALIDSRFSQLPVDSPPLLRQKLLSIKAETCLLLRRFNESSEALVEILAHDPNQTKALLLQGVLYIQAQQYTNAIPPLSRLLELEERDQSARLNRAIAYLQSGQLDFAEADYQELLDPNGDIYQIHFGLGEIAWQRKHYTQAGDHYEAYIRSAPPDTEESREILRRLESIKSGNL